MTWGFVAVGTSIGSSVIGAVSGADSSNRAALRNSEQSFLNEAAAWEENVAVNKSIAEANLQNAIRTGYRTGILNLQRAEAQKGAIQAGTSLTSRKRAVQASNAADAAANGTVGASVDAVVSDITQQGEEVAAQQSADYDTQVLNFDTQMHDILMSGIDAMRAPQRTSVQAGQMAETTSISSAVTGALIQSAGKWASSYMSLGLGSTGTAASSSATGASTAAGRINDRGGY